MPIGGPPGCIYNVIKHRLLGIRAGVARVTLCGFLGLSDLVVILNLNGLGLSDCVVILNLRGLGLSDVVVINLRGLGLSDVVVINLRVLGLRDLVDILNLRGLLGGMGGAAAAGLAVGALLRDYPLPPLPST